MSILTQYREKLHLKNVEKDIHNQKKSTGTFTGLKTVGILLDGTDTNIQQKALAYAKQIGKKAGTVDLLSYVNVKELKEELPFESFCKKDLDWLWRPKANVATKFKQKKFDLLINLCQTDCFPLEYLAVSLNANYKIGALTDYPNNYNLMLESKTLDKYLEQVSFFINKFSNT